MPRPQTSISPDPREIQKQPSSERVPQGARQYHHRHHGKFSRRDRNRHSYAGQKENRRNGRASFGARTYPWQPTDALDLGLHPRTFEELHAEKHAQYQNTNPKVRVKIDGIPVSGASGQERREEAEKDEEKRLRNARRQRFWVRQQIEMTINAERDLLVRLRARVTTHAPEYGYGTYHLQSSHWSQYPGQDSLLNPNASSYQPGSELNAEYTLSSIQFGRFTIQFEHGFGGHGDPDEFSLLADGLLKKHGY
ncbi:hypothetical protein F5Y03DRAFT_394318 [Xylaria venustula]|nr:hypothetical protein F5Y03DRAFT_394318 [Xylaria venustula]